MIIALCETIWLANEERWVSRDEWRYWKCWVHQLNNSPYFRWTLKWVEGDYDEKFLKSLWVAEQPNKMKTIPNLNPSTDFLGVLPFKWGEWYTLIIRRRWTICL